MSETNGTAAPSNGSALDEAEELVAHADDLRARLLSLRADLSAQIGRIDSMLAKLPGAPVQTLGGTSADDMFPDLPVRIERTDTVPGLLMSIVSKAPGGLTSREVIAAAQKKRPKLKANDVLAGLYRLHRKKGALRAEGPKGSMRYFVAGLAGALAGGGA
jgi:hypothetical protein